jgi:hypothetical protein
MRRLFAKPVPLPKAERKRLHKLQARYDALCDKYPDGDMSTDDAAICTGTAGILVQHFEFLCRDRPQDCRLV